MSFRIHDVIPYEQHKKMVEKAARQIERQKRTITDMKSKLEKAQCVLNAPLTKGNLTNAVIALESLSSRDYMLKFVSKWIIKNAKSPNIYCRMIKNKCEATGRAYNGLNKTFSTFNNLPEWFVYEAFKERAISSIPSSFSLRFRDALVAFILHQQKYADRKQISFLDATNQ